MEAIISFRPEEYGQTVYLRADRTDVEIRAKQPVFDWWVQRWAKRNGVVAGSATIHIYEDCDRYRRRIYDGEVFYLQEYWSGGTHRRIWLSWLIVRDAPEDYRQQIQWCLSKNERRQLQFSLRVPVGAAAIDE